MDENKNDILEEGSLEETAGEIEETIEEVTESVEEAAEDFDDALAEEQEDASEAMVYVDVELLVDEVAALRRQNKTLKSILKAILAVVITAALAVGSVTIYRAVYNPYNHMGYYNISGMTLADVAKENGVSLDDAIFQLGLPKDVKGDTYYDVVEYLVPVSRMAQMYGIDFETMKESFGFGDEITADSTWGEAMDSMPLSSYMGSEETIEEVKSEYNLGDDVTADTLWGEIRPIINKIDYERHLAEQATANDMDVTEAE